MVKRKGFTLLELLVVMAIIGTLMGLLLPAIFQIRTRAKIFEAKSDVKQLSIAWNQYLLEYHKFPDVPISIIDSNALSILRGDPSSFDDNPRDITFMDFRSNTVYFCDPWSTGGMDRVYNVKLDVDLQNYVTHPDTGDDIPLHVIVWSNGPDGDSGTEDDVGSWSEGM